MPSTQAVAVASSAFIRVASRRTKSSFLRRSVITFLLTNRQPPILLYVLNDGDEFGFPALFQVLLHSLSHSFVCDNFIEIMQMFYQFFHEELVLHASFPLRAINRPKAPQKNRHGSSAFLLAVHIVSYDCWKISKKEG